MFAAYPLYLPIYLGEYESNEQRATVVVFAGSQQKVSSLFPVLAQHSRPLHYRPSLSTHPSSPHRRGYHQATPSSSRSEARPPSSSLASLHHR